MGYGTDFLGSGRGGYGRNIQPEGVQPVEPITPFENPTALLARILWQPPIARSLQPAISYGLAVDNSTGTRAPFDTAEPTSSATASPWARLEPQETNQPTAWQQGEPRSQAVVMPWQQLQPREVNQATAWRDTLPRDLPITLRYQNPPIMDRVLGVPWGRAVVRDTLRSADWPLGEMRFPDWRIVWGQGLQPRTIVPDPAIFDPVPQPDPPEPVYVPPPGNAVALPLNCLLDQQPGNQIALPFRKFACLRRTFVVDNDIILRRQSNGQEVACRSLSITGDVESYLFGWQAEIAKADQSLIEPGPVVLEAVINGQTFLLLAESYSDGSAFDRTRGRDDALTVRGRSIAAELDEPISPPKSRFERETRTALQLMNQELPLNGDWSLVAPADWDYTIPGDTFSYTDLTPIQAIARIAAATGAVIQQKPGERVLRVVPRYPVAPWHWATEGGEDEIDYGQIRSASGDFNASPKRVGIYVAGEINGVLVKATRTGTAGDPWADMVTDPLITDPQAGLRRAIAELGATGKRRLYQIVMPVDDGIYPVGTLINVIETEATDWRALVIGWAISGRWSDQRGLEIWQTVSLERYLDT